VWRGNSASIEPRATRVRFERNATVFTGIVQTSGVLEARERRGPGFRLRVKAPFGELVLGESIAVNGACLTVDECLPSGFLADVSAETNDKTTLGRIAPGARVNLERALAVGERMGGHFVTGHVDATCQVVDLATVGSARRLRIRAPEALLHLIATKGSVTLDGVSLTVNAVRGTSVEVMLIPHTLAATTLERLHPGQDLNLEVDILARYVERNMNGRA
jgi:riboflavin synthase